MNLEELNQKIGTVSSLYEKFQKLSTNLGELFGISDKNAQLFHAGSRSSETAKLIHLLRSIKNNEGEHILKLFKIDPDDGYDNFDTLYHIDTNGIEERLDRVNKLFTDTIRRTELVEDTRSLRDYSRKYESGSDIEEYVKRAFRQNEKCNISQYMEIVSLYSDVFVHYVTTGTSFVVMEKDYTPFNIIGNGPQLIPSLNTLICFQWTIFEGLLYAKRYDWMLELKDEINDGSMIQA